MTLRFTIPGPPRTKKTSQRVVKCGSFTKVLPSEAHEAWFKLAMQQAPLIVATLRCNGAQLPITAPVAIRATFYRERLVGDILGYEQALADWLQTPARSKSGKVIRKGAGIIADDAQIVHWDGSRLAKDASCPRIEVEVEQVGPGQGGLF